MYVKQVSVHQDIAELPITAKNHIHAAQHVQKVVIAGVGGWFRKMRRRKMLELIYGGRCMSGLDAIEFMESLADVFDEDTKTEEFCDLYQRALNRFRYEIRKNVPVKVKKFDGKLTVYKCGACSNVLAPQDNYCPRCGRMIDWRR